MSKRVEFGVLFLLVILALVWVASVPAAAEPGEISLSVGLALDGRVVQPVVVGGYLLTEAPVKVFGELVYVDGALGFAFSTPSRSLLEPVGNWAGVKWAPWALEVQDHVLIGGWVAKGDSWGGGPYVAIRALQWDF